MSPRNHRDYIELLKVAAHAERIYFHDTLPEERWPEAHSSHFKTIRKLGKCVCEAAHDDNINLQSISSAEHMKRRARRIRKAAESLLSQGANEIEWRLALEDEILARFKYEVTCKTCRRRLWRSREEVDVTALSPEAQRDIERVRHQRAKYPCQCSREQRDTDEKETGLNEVFSSRAEQTVVRNKQSCGTNSRARSSLRQEATGQIVWSSQNGELRSCTYQSARYQQEGYRQPV